MTDMLVRLYDHQLDSQGSVVAESRFEIRQGLASDKDKICGFVAQNFGHDAPGWVSECEVALSRLPTSCFVAVHGGEILGFCCYDGVAKGMLGPLGVRADFRSRGVARALLFRSLQAMKAAGYAYAVIGWVHSEDYYRKACGAIAIPDSFPGVYSRLITQVTHERNQR